MTGDLLIKQRLPNGELSEPVPAFTGGETQNEKITRLQASNDSLLILILDMYEIGGAGN